ncbi:MAG TPA: BON domain-containing protein [Lacipirellulaceae bacterium]
MRTALSISIGMAFLLALPSQLPAQEEGAGESIGRRIDRGLDKITEEVREAWAKARRQVDELGVQGRVYGRLRWDKALADQPIDVAVEKESTDEQSTVILTGRVPDEAARKKAIELAQDTVGVREVIDRLRVEPRGQAEDPNAPTPTPDN